MYITNKRVVIPKSINSQTINVVDKFRLLGVLVDNKYTVRSKSEKYINEFLESFGFNSFQYRFITKILLLSSLKLVQLIQHQLYSKNRFNLKNVLI
jgi:hypothetical protein